MKKRKYMTKAEAADRGLYVKTDLKNLFRLKPAPNQKPVDWIWSGWDCYHVFEKSLCVPMRPKKDLTHAQRYSIERAREMIGTRPCERNGCGGRSDSRYFGHYLCPECTYRFRRNNCAKEANSWLSQDFVVIDTETTGLNSLAEVVEISIIDKSGNIILDSMVKPSVSIPSDASRIHGITDDQVSNVPTWRDIHDKVIGIISGRLAIAYNAAFDFRVMRQSAEKYKLDWPRLERECAMELYAEFFGQKRYDGDYTWQKLSDAADDMMIEVSGAHRSLSDCRTTLDLINAISSRFDPEIDGWTFI